MTSHSIAAFRRGVHDDLRSLAQDHFQNDLQESDRQVLQQAAKKISWHSTAGSILGIGVGAYMAFRLRQGRRAFFAAFRAREKPTHVMFSDGRTEPLPDVTSLVAPTPIGDFFTYFFFAVGGLFIGGEGGVVTGTFSASRSITKDPESRGRIERAFAKFRADVLRKEIEILEKQSVEGGEDGNTSSGDSSIQFWS